MDREEQVLNAALESGITVGHHNADSRYGKFDKRIILSAMREFARERSIGFKVWADVHGWDINPEQGGHYTTDQLYTLYLESLNPKPIKT